MAVQPELEAKIVTLRCLDRWSVRLCAAVAGCQLHETSLKASLKMLRGYQQRHSALGPHLRRELFSARANERCVTHKLAFLSWATLPGKRVMCTSPRVGQ